MIMINEFFVIDSHCHIYPEKIAEKAVAGTDAFYGTTAAGKGTVPDLLKMGAAAGVDHFIVQSVATTPKQVASINTFIAQKVAASDGKMTGLGTLHPDSEDIEGDVNEIIKLGLHGVKLHPDIQRFAMDADKCMPMYELCQYHNLPMLIHTGDYRYDYSNPNRVEPVLKNFPHLVMIGAHLGGWSVCTEASEKLAKYENLFVDCSSTFPFTTDHDAALEAINRYGTDRVMFGSDYPMWSPKNELDFFMRLDFTDAERRKMLKDTAKQIFNLRGDF